MRGQASGHHLPSPRQAVCAAHAAQLVCHPADLQHTPSTPRRPPSRPRARRHALWNRQHAVERVEHAQELAVVAHAPAAGQAAPQRAVRVQQRAGRGVLHRQGQRRVAGLQRRQLLAAGHLRLAVQPRAVQLRRGERRVGWRQTGTCQGWGAGGGPQHTEVGAAARPGTVWCGMSAGGQCAAGSAAGEAMRSRQCGWRSTLAVRCLQLHPLAPAAAPARTHLHAPPEGCPQPRHLPRQLLARLHARSCHAVPHDQHAGGRGAAGKSASNRRRAAKRIKGTMWGPKTWRTVPEGGSRPIRSASGPPRTIWARRRASAVPASLGGPGGCCGMSSSPSAAAAATAGASSGCARKAATRPAAARTAPPAPEAARHCGGREGGVGGGGRRCWAGLGKRRRQHQACLQAGKQSSEDRQPSTAGERGRSAGRPPAPGSWRRRARPPPPGPAAWPSPHGAARGRQTR